MNKAFIKALAISFVLGITFSLFVNVVTATSIETNMINNTKNILHGLEAANHIISSSGIISFLRLCFGYFILFFLSTLFGCITFYFWHNESNNRNQT